MAPPGGGAAVVGPDGSRHLTERLIVGEPLAEVGDAGRPPGLDLQQLVVAVAGLTAAAPQRGTQRRHAVVIRSVPVARDVITAGPHSGAARGVRQQLLIERHQRRRAVLHRQAFQFGLLKQTINTSLSSISLISHC